MASRDDTEFALLVAGVGLLTGAAVWALWPGTANAAGVRGATVLPGGRVTP